MLVTNYYPVFSSLLMIVQKKFQLFTLDLVLSRRWQVIISRNSDQEWSRHEETALAPNIIKSYLFNKSPQDIIKVRSNKLRN